jgi:hypothetical protein
VNQAEYTFNSGGNGFFRGSNGLFSGISGLHRGTENKIQKRSSFSNFLAITIRGEHTTDKQDLKVLKRQEQEPSQ